MFFNFDKIFVQQKLDEQISIMYLKQNLIIITREIYNIELNMLIINNLVKKN